MNELRIFENTEFGLVRTMIVDGEWWFVGNDVARALGYSKVYEAVKNNVEEMDTALMGVIDSLGREQKTTMINESGLYSLAMSSRLPSAKRFKHWVTSEILPSIRKNGGYISGQETMTDNELLEKALLVAQRKIAERDKMILEQNNKIQELSPKGLYFDAICDARLLTNFRDAAKELGMSQTQFTGYLKSNGYVYATRKGELRPTEPYRASDLFQMKSYVNPHNGFSGIRTYLTPKGVQYFKLAFEANGLIPDALPKHGGRNRNAKRIKA